jgi:tetratricopeptide (TPR) repeat protein
LRSIEEFRTIFSTSDDFNVIFDAFEEALRTGLKDLELYRMLFWNNALSPDEVRLFGERLAKEFDDLAYDVFLWLASVFEVTYSAYDNFELALHYYRKAAEARPAEVEPYVNAADCYEPDLNIPPADQLLAFLRSGLPVVTNKKVVLLRLAYICEMIGDEEQARYYRSLADDIERSRN